MKIFGPLLKILLRTSPYHLRVVLLFPPVNNFRRYLIHYLVHTTFEKNNLNTISIGSLYARRTAVYPSCLKPIDNSSKKSRISNANKAPEQKLYRPPAMRRSVENPSAASSDRKSKKPDRQFYVPRGRRILMSKESREDEQIDGDAHASCDEVSPTRQSLITIIHDESTIEADNSNIPSRNSQENESSSSEKVVQKIDDAEENSRKNAVSESPTKTENDSSKVGDGGWEDLFDDDGDCLDKNLMKELMTEVGKVTIHHAAENYAPFQTTEERTSDGDCIIEIFGFSSDFKTDDLVTIFAAYRTDPTFQIVWVDDTHALAVFSSPTMADQVLNTKLPYVKTRPLKNAIPKSRVKARNFILPPTTRPKTCVSLARRLVSGHLGMKINVTSEQREAERKLLSDARENKRRIAKQKQDAWEGS